MFSHMLCQCHGQAKEFQAIIDYFKIFLTKEATLFVVLAFHDLHAVDLQLESFENQFIMNIL